MTHVFVASNKMARFLTIVAWAILSQSPNVAWAEWYADLYGGGAITMRHNVGNALPGFSATAHDVKFDTSATVGGRTGVWFDRLPWLGVGIDVFHFQPTVGGGQTVEVTGQGLNTLATLQTINFSVIGVGLDVVRLRLPLFQSENFPHGRLQPYVTGGPAFFRTRLKDTTNLGPPANQSTTDTSLGLKVGAGVSYQFTELIGLFGEYRFTHFQAQHALEGPVVLTETFNTHHMIGGLSFRF
ncbi:MAG: outer membrane beta-barrel protein [Nitrospirota bacterium]